MTRDRFEKCCRWSLFAGFSGTIVAWLLWSMAMTYGCAAKGMDRSTIHVEKPAITVPIGVRWGGVNGGTKSNVTAGGNVRQTFFTINGKDAAGGLALLALGLGMARSERSRRVATRALLRVMEAIESYPATAATDTVNVKRLIKAIGIAKGHNGQPDRLGLLLQRLADRHFNAHKRSPKT